MVARARNSYNVPSDGNALKSHRYAICEKEATAEQHQRLLSLAEQWRDCVAIVVMRYCRMNAIVKTLQQYFAALCRACIVCVGHIFIILNININAEDALHAAQTPL